MTDNEDVRPDPSTGDDDATDSPDEKPEGGTPESEDEGGKSKGRSIENVRREFARKHEELMGQVMELQTKILDVLSAPKAPPTKASDNPLDDMSIEQLTLHRDKVPEASRGVYDQYLIDRRVKEQVKLAVNEQQQNMGRETERQRFNTMALERYPDLNDRTSEFRREVDKKIREWGDTRPRAVLDAANEVALELGVRPSRKPSVIPAAPGENKPSPRQKEELPMSEAVAKDIAAKLQNALPAGKKFDIKKIRERQAQYKKRTGSMLRG